MQCRAGRHLRSYLEHTAGLLVDEAGDALDTATAGQAADGGLGDALDVVAQHLAVALGAALAEALAALAASRHVVERWSVLLCRASGWVGVGRG